MFAIFLGVSPVQIVEISPPALLIFGPPALVWMWGRALERLAIGVERLDDVIQRLRVRRRSNRRCRTS
jgi:hypothetical protein